MVRSFSAVVLLGAVSVNGRRDNFDHRRQLFEQVRAAEGGKQPTDTQRWVGAQSGQDGIVVYNSECNFTVPLDSEIEQQADASTGQAHYIYCDLHHFWPDGLFTQFVPQLQRGDMTCSNDAQYNISGCSHEEAWYIQAQYIWSETVGPSTAQSLVKGWVGDMIQVNPGQLITTKLAYTSCDNTMGWSLSISDDTGRTSSLCITTPFMGRNPNYSAPYSSGQATSDYWEFILGDLHEAWNMNSPGYYPESQTISVKYNGKDDAKVSGDEVDQNQCDNHNTGGSCADNVMLPTISQNVDDVCIFTLKREGPEVVV